ncbi:MAG: hypothetical protein GC179_29020 [Anaerolineaceae bacterium]|nr:hypothetical protein [Anaerolineaceae bacterium]
MTNPGLYSGIYQQIREYAELVDSILVKLKTDQGDDKSLRFELADLLAELSVERTDTLSTRMIALLVIGDDAMGRARWLRLSNNLKAEKVATTTIYELEKLAQLLEQVQATAVAKMRGWSL